MCSHIFFFSFESSNFVLKELWFIPPTSWWWILEVLNDKNQKNLFVFSHVHKNHNQHHECFIDSENCDSNLDNRWCLVTTNPWAQERQSTWSHVPMVLVLMSVILCFIFRKLRLHSIYIYIYIYGIHIGILSRSVGGYHSKHAKWESLFHIGGYTQQCLFPYGKFMKWSRSCHYLQMGILYALWCWVPSCARYIWFA